jgi:class 3 adenylate cyclase
VSELPQGTVTFLFTDIEGSTELLKRLGPRYGEAPWVPLVNFETVDVVSKRVGDYEYSPAIGTPVLDQLWVH